MSESFDLPVNSPVVPAKLFETDSICFNCHKDISCFNECCKKSEVVLTPYDIIRMKNHLGITSGEFLKKYTYPFEMDADGMPGIKLLKEEDGSGCKFVTSEGCSIYEERPLACRYYPLGLLSMRQVDKFEDETAYFKVQEEHCKGHLEDRKISIGDYRKEQKVDDIDQITRPWRQIVLKKRSTGPAVGKASETSYQFFFMCSYDIDRFREFITKPGFIAAYEIENYDQLLEDDVELLRFGFKLMLKVLFGEDSVTMKDGAAASRMEERKEAWEQRKAAEKAVYAARQDNYDIDAENATRM
jgi:uncharacterized protein